MKRKAFTLVELLVVIGILALLIAVLVGLFSGSTESARAVKCMANLRSLAVAASILTDDKHQPLRAGSQPNTKIMSRGGFSFQRHMGWLGWDDRGSSSSDSQSANQSMLISAYNQDPETQMYAYTNGTFFSILQGNTECFQCPTHLAVMKKKRIKPAWSYVMNANYGWASAIVKKAPPRPRTGTARERRLLFAELPFLGTEGEVDTSEDPGFKNDCTLQFDGCGTTAEYIGFNHRTSKRTVCAHLVFADSHVEKLVWPQEGLSESELIKLTKWLCTGVSVSFNGKNYEEVK